MSAATRHGESRHKDRIPELLGEARLTALRRLAKRRDRRVCFAKLQHEPVVISGPGSNRSATGPAHGLALTAGMAGAKEDRAEALEGVAGTHGAPWH